MKIGDLVRHIVHSGALGIIVDWNELNPATAKVHWTNNSWPTLWILTQDFEVIDENK